MQIVDKYGNTFGQGHLIVTSKSGKPKVPTVTVAWGNITGILSNQTDLQNALNLKVPTARTITINGNTQDLSADRTWTISTGITVNTTPITGGSTGRLLFDNAGVVSETNSAFWDVTNQRVGIGTTNPGLPLHVVGGTRLSFTTTSVVHGWGNTLLDLVGNNGTNPGVNEGRLHIGYNQNDPELRVNSGGVVVYTGKWTFIPQIWFAGGITSTHNTAITIDGMTNGVSSGTAGEIFRFTQRGGQFGSFYDAGGGLSEFRIWRQTDNTKYIYLKPGSTSIISSGSLLINTTTDAGFKLDVAGTTRVQNTLSISNPLFTSGGSITHTANATLVITGGPGGGTENITFGPSNRIFINAQQSRFPNGSVQIAGTLSVGNQNATSTNMLLLGGSITAGSALGRGIGIDTTLVAAANNDVLIGLDIAPTFTNGAFTGLANIDLRTKGAGVVIGSGAGYGAIYGYDNDGLLQLKTNGTSTELWFRPNNSAASFNSSYWGTIIQESYSFKILSGSYQSLVIATARAGGNGGIMSFSGATGAANNAITIAGPANAGRIALVTYGSSPITLNGGNILINTTTDAGYKLDVNGTAIIGDSSNYGTVFKVRTPGSGWNFDYQYLSLGTVLKLGLDRLELRVNNNTAYIGNNGDSSNASLTVMSGHDAAATSFAPIIFGSGRNASLTREVMRVDNQNKYVGIGTTSPFGKFDVKDGEIFVTTSTNANLRSRLTYQGLYVSRASDGGYPENIISTSSAWLYNSRNSHTFFRDGVLLLSIGGLQSTAGININNNGNVLINTATDAGYKLDVAGTTRIQNTLTVSSPGFTALNTAHTFVVDTGSNNYRTANLLQWYGYHAGSGTNNTLDAFAVGGNSSSSSNASYFFRVNLAGGNSSGPYGASGNNVALAQLNAPTTSRLYLTAQGGGGLVEGSTNGFLISTVADGHNLSLRSEKGAGGSGGGINYLSSINGSNHSHRFFHNNVEQMRLQYSGNLLIGTTTDAGYKLHVNGTARVTEIEVNNNVTNTRARLTDSSLQFSRLSDGGYTPSISRLQAAGGLLYEGYDGGHRFVRGATILAQINVSNPGYSGSGYLGVTNICTTYIFTGGNDSLFLYSDAGSGSNDGIIFDRGTRSVNPVHSVTTWKAAGVEKARFTQGGALLINTTAVSSFKLDVNGSANVQSGLTVSGSLNLNSSDISSAWTTYTPTWSTDGATQPSLGDGTITGAYKVIGKTVFVRVRLVFGTTTTAGTGTFYFSLPVNAAAGWGVQMPASILDNGNAWYQATVNGEYGGLTDRVALIGQSAGGANSSQGVTGVFPIGFGNTDSIQFNGSYESA